MASKLRTASWVLLAIAGALNLLGALASAFIAYSGGEYQIGPVSVDEIAAGREAVTTALRGIRGTSAAFAAGYAVFFLFVVLVPYRRGEVWAWWAILAGMLAVVLLVLARIPLLGTQLGAAAGVLILVSVGLGLLLDVGRLRRISPPPSRPA